MEKLKQATIVAVVAKAHTEASKQASKQESYKQAAYFDLIDFLHLVDLTRPPYIFFSSTKSEFIRFIHYMVTTRKENWQSFDGAKRIVVNASVSYNGKYEDNLVYKF